MIPATVRLFGKRWTVAIVKKLKDHGNCEYEKCRILVRGTDVQECQRDTLLHELLHAIDNEMQTNAGERRVRLLATGLLAALRDNPALVAYLMEGSSADTQAE